MGAQVWPRKTAPARTSASRVLACIADLLSFTGTGWRCVESLCWPARAPRCSACTAADSPTSVDRNPIHRCERAHLTHKQVAQAPSCRDVETLLFHLGHV